MSSALQHLSARGRRGAVGALALTLGVLAAGLAAEVLAAPTGLSLGRDNLAETRTEVTLAPGVKLLHIVRGTAAADADEIATTRFGPWRIRLLAIDPEQATGHLRATHGSDVARTETTSALARRVGALAATNGGFFSIGSDSGSRGNPTGLAVHAGRVQSEPTDYAPETHFLFDAATTTARVTKLSWQGAVTHRPSGAALFLDHVNSPPRIPLNCGGRRDPLKCVRSGELAVFTPEWGPVTPSGAGVELVLDRAGCLVRTALTRGVTRAPGQYSIQATGFEVPALLRLVALGCVQRNDVLTDPNGVEVPLTRSTFAVNGRHQLVSAGRVVAPTGEDPFSPRSPRTIAGVAADGRLMLATIDGRSRYSVGATLREAARVAKSLGMVEAINLDGGGSSTMSVRGRAINLPSDGRERAVGDALVWVPVPWRSASDVPSFSQRR